MINLKIQEFLEEQSLQIDVQGVRLPQIHNIGKAHLETGIFKLSQTTFSR